MSQLVALQVRAPQVDLADLEGAAQRARANDIANSLSQYKLREAGGQSDALQSYRSALGARNPAALDTLRGYPELQKQMYDAFDGMTPDQYMAAKKKANAFAEAAQYVAGFPSGTRERADAWSQKIDELSSAGHMPPEQANSLKSAGPNDLILNEAMTANEFVQKYTGKNAAADKLKLEKTQAEIEKVKAQTQTEVAKRAGRGTTKKDDRRALLDVKKNVLDYRKMLGLGADSVLDETQRAAAEAEAKRYEQELMTEVFPDRVKAPVAPAVGTGVPGGRDDILAKARDAIQRGADPEAVKKRLSENGIDPAGL
jgi:hypothetical protein